jgi:RHS repeat-associated protein
MKKFAAIGIFSALFCASAVATDWSAADYDLYPGDFDGDGKADLLYVAKDVSKASGIARSDASGGPNEPYQSWPSNAFGIPWHSQIYKIIVEDFNGDERSDLFLQRQTAGDHFLLLTGPNGKVAGISQTIANSALGQVWSADKHRLHAGDFNGDNKADLFLQAASASDSNSVVYADANGYFTSGPTQTWTDATWGAFKWSAKNSNIFVGDFNGDGRADLLVQAKPNIVLIDYEIPIPVPTYPANSNGVVLSQGGATPFAQIGVQSWSRNANGVDWSPNAANIIVGDFDNNGRTDVLLQARNSTRPSYLISGNASGAVFTSASTLASNVTWAGDSYRLLAGNFDGSGGAGVYFQAATSAGTNYYANTITGGSVFQATHTPSAATGVVAATAVGHTVGSFSVSDGGSASYSIPVVVPPGVAGLQPALSINYASGGGNGPLGIGWGIGGFSEISRCGKTLVQDNSTDSVLLSMSDRFCLDGNKLRVTSGTYGASGSTYQTEFETFARVTANGSAGNGPAHFVVEAKDGLIYEYGNTADSRIESLSPVASTTPRTWALNKVTDRHGNYMTITYQEDGAPNGSFRPTVIYYTGNSTTGLAAAYRILIQWESRPSTEKVEGYLAGGVIRETQRLTAIETQYNEPGVGWRKVRKYDFSYNNSGVGGQSRLAAIQECDRNDSCLSPTTIGWQEGTFGWNSVEVTSSALPGNVAGGFTIDMNGDGKADYVYFDPSTNYWRVRFGNSDGTFQAAVNAFGGGTHVLSSAMPADVNGDGRMDLLVPNTNDLKWWWVRHASGSSFDASTTSLAINTPGVQGTFMADVNGDGLSDYVYADAASVYVRQNTSSASTASFAAASQHWTVPDSFNTIWNSAFGTTADLNQSDFQSYDVDADGRDDILVRVRVDRCAGDPECNLDMLYEWKLLRSSGTSFVAAGTVHSGTTMPVRPTPADVNADGVTDLVYSAGATNNQQTNTWRYRLGMAGGSIIGGEVNSGVTLQGTSGSITDCDVDGRSDIVFTSTSSVPQCLRSNGAGPVSPPTDLPTSPGHTVADVNGDGLLDFITSDASSLRVRLHRGVLPDYVANITDGFGNTVDITYAPLTDSTVYTPGTGAVFPEVDVQGPMYVVKQYTASDGVGGVYTISETYAQARAHTRGRGFLGFRTRSAVDSRTGIKSTTTYRQDHPYIGFAEKVSTYQPGGVTLISEVTNTPAYLATSTTQFNERGLPYTQQSVQKTYEVAGPSNGLQIIQVTTTTTLDSYGNPTNVTTTTADSTGSGLVYTSSTVNVYSTSDPDCLWRGFVTRRTVTNTVPGLASQTRTADYVKDTAKPLACRVQQEIVEPNDGTGTLKVTTAISYDSFGHPTGQSISAANIETRTTSTNYGTQGVFPMSVTQSVSSTFSHEAYKTYDFALGVPKTATDPNGLVVSYQYDGFGRLIEEARPDGTKTTFSYSACTAANNYCGDGRLRYQVEKRELDAAGGLIRTSKQHFDSFSRALYSQAQTLSGAFTNVATNYDSLGRAYQQSQPYFTGFSPTFTTIYFDLVGRPTSEQRRVSDTDASTQTTQYTYNRLVSAIVDANNKTTTKETNAIGQVIKMTDAAGGITQYQYDPFGNLTKTIDPANNQIVNTFNIRGFKTSTNDPDMGYWAYTYYPTGELATQTDAKSQTVSFTYDRISRPKTRMEPEGTTTFNYGESATAASKTRGKLVSVFAPGSFSESFIYDGLGRLVDATTNADATPFVVSNSYNATTGFLETVTYPNSTSAVPGSRFKVKYEYENGLLKRTRDFNTPSTIYWEQVATNAAGQAIDEQLGNGLHTYSTYDSMTGLLGARSAGSTSQVQNLTYQWDKLGNLTQRRDLGLNLTENFYYDNLYRLDYSQLNGVTNLDPAYNTIGNITSKGGMTYSYPASGASSVRPHAVTAAGANSYAYDNNGNMMTRNGSSITWYSYNLPNRIDQGSNYSQFFYGADRARYKQIAHVATGPLPAGTETTIYVGGLYERVTKPSGVTEHKHYILAGKEPIAIRTLRSNGANDTRYLHKDHLGSVDVISNESGSVVERFSYDAFGKRRSATAWSGAPGASTWTSAASMTHRGFTFHEQLDNVGLIHMNGRVYDPDIGRFISADPFIQAPLMSQSLNRYSYAMNNPLSLIDPSGYSWLSKGLRSIAKFFKKYWREIVAVVVAVVVTIATGGIGTGFWGAVANGAIAGATYGATVTALYGGNAGQILRGALIGGVTGGISGGLTYGLSSVFSSPTTAASKLIAISFEQTATERIGAQIVSTGINADTIVAITAAYKALSKAEQAALNADILHTAYNAKLKVQNMEKADFAAWFLTSADKLSAYWYMQHTKIDEDLSRMVRKAGNGLAGTGTELVIDVALELALTKGTGKLLPKAARGAWEAIETSQSARARAEGAVQRPGTLVFEEIRCNLDGEAGCQAIFSIVPAR